MSESSKERQVAVRFAGKDLERLEWLESEMELSTSDILRIAARELARVKGYK